jgi:uncharacterized protein (DUF302 family)
MDTKAYNNMQGLFLVSESQYVFGFTVEKLTTAIASVNWRLSAVHDLQATLKKSNQDILPIKIFEICKPEYSGRLLSVDSLRVYSPFMPCRISVYETENGKTYISRMNLGMMDQQIGGLVEEVMKEAFEEMETLLNEIVIKQL